MASLFVFIIRAVATAQHTEVTEPLVHLGIWSFHMFALINEIVTLFKYFIH